MTIIMVTMVTMVTMITMMTMVAMVAMVTKVTKVTTVAVQGECFCGAEGHTEGCPDLVATLIPAVMEVVQ